MKAGDAGEVLPADSPADVRREIERCLLAYTRGIDRLDGGLVAAAFHPGATLEGYGRAGQMTVEAFVAAALPSLGDGYEATQHRLANITFDHRHDHVVVESYVEAGHVRSAGDGPDQLLTFNGRYIDRFEKRDGRWRIAERRLRVDWTRIADLGEAMPGDYICGSRDHNDVSYGFQRQRRATE